MSDANTLAGLVETHGRPYPHLLEKAILLGSIAAAICAGNWMWFESGWPTFALWGMSLCGIPLLTLLVAEGLSRLVHRVHMRN